MMTRKEKEGECQEVQDKIHDILMNDLLTSTTCWVRRTSLLCLVIVGGSLVSTLGECCKGEVSSIGARAPSIEGSAAGMVAPSGDSAAGWSDASTSSEATMIAANRAAFPSTKYTCQLVFSKIKTRAIDKRRPYKAQMNQSMHRAKNSSLV